MSNGFKLGTIAGNPIFVQPPFLILLVLFVASDVDAQRPLAQALLWVPILLVSVLFHEFGHAAMIRAFGFGRSVILLSGFGGLTVNRRVSRPWQEFTISLAGPLSSFILGGISLAALPFIGGGVVLQTFMSLFITSNFVWGVFNLLPIFPLDGGQAANHVLRMLTNERRATVISAVSSFLIAVPLIAAAIMFRQIFAAIIVLMMIGQNVSRLRTPPAPPPVPPSPEEPAT